MSGNVTVLVSDDGVLLIDDKFANDHDGVMAQLREDHEAARAIRHQHALASGSHGRQRADAGARPRRSSRPQNARRISMAETQAEGHAEHRARRLPAHLSRRHAP